MPAARSLIESFADGRIHIIEFDDAGRRAHEFRPRPERGGCRQPGAKPISLPSATRTMSGIPENSRGRSTALPIRKRASATPMRASCRDSGDVLAASLFEHESRSRSASFADLLIMNSVTGMTAVFRRDVARAAQPFPLSGCRYILHDHWIALVASLLGDVRFIDEPLVDYTQHAANVMGARAWQGSLPRARSRSNRRTAISAMFSTVRLAPPRAATSYGGALPRYPRAHDQLAAGAVRALFDCEFGIAAGLSLSLTRRLRGEWRQADQMWRIWRGKTLFCSSRQ